MAKTVEQLEKELQEAISSLGKAHMKIEKLEAVNKALIHGFASCKSMLTGARRELWSYVEKPQGVSEEQAYKSPLCGPYTLALKRYDYVFECLIRGDIPDPE